MSDIMYAERTERMRERLMANPRYAELCSKREQRHWEPGSKLRSYLARDAEHIAPYSGAVDELAQVGLSASWEAHAKYDAERGEASFVTYARAVARNAMIEAMAEQMMPSSISVPRKAVGAMLSGVGSEYVSQAVKAAAVDVEDDPTSPEFEEVHEQEVLADGFEDELVDALDLRDAIEEMPPEERAVIELYYWDELTDDEIAERLGEHRTTVTRRREKAQLRLATRMGEQA